MLVYHVPTVTTLEDDMTIQDATDIILYDASKAPMWLKAADKYREQFAGDPDNFVLPRQYAAITPVIEQYGNNLGGFVRYIAGIRDALKDMGADGPAADVQELYRRVYTRYTQQFRRKRSAKALAQAIKLHGDAPFTTKLTWTAKLETIWRKRRLAFLDAARKAHGGRLSQVEKVDALAEFWDMIDAGIDAGERIPPWT